MLQLNELRLDSGGLTGTGLSQCVRHVLGKPLDKVRLSAAHLTARSLMVLFRLSANAA
jgi:hypothetical protein